MDIDETQASVTLAALGHEARLLIFRILVKAGPEGLNIGEIAEKIRLPPSTLAHHLERLVQAGLVAQEKQGREVRNRAQYKLLEAVLGFVVSCCCEDVKTPPIGAKLEPETADAD